jgi:hypothetical protein
MSDDASKDPTENIRAAIDYTYAVYDPASLADWGKPGGYERAAMSPPVMRVRRCWDCGRVHRWCWLVGKVRRRLGLKW